MPEDTLHPAHPGDPKDRINWPRYAQLLVQLNESDQFLSKAAAQELLTDCLRYCRIAGQYQAGADLADRIRGAWSRTLAIAHPAMCELTTAQSNLLRGLGEFEKAHALDTELMDNLSVAPEADTGMLLNARSGLAADQRFLGHYQDALREQREVVATAQQLHGTDHDTTLLASHNLGVSLRLTGRYAEALQVDRDTFTKRQALALPLDSLESGNVLARDMRLLGRHADAVDLQRRVVHQFVEQLGADHPKTQWAQHNLLLCRWQTNPRHEGIEGAFSELLQRVVKTMGRGHFQALAVMTSLGNLQHVRGNTDSAYELIAEAEQGYRRLLGEAHPVSIGMRTNTGLTLEAQGQLDQAQAQFEWALEGLRDALGRDHPVAMGAAVNAARCRSRSSTWDAADLIRDTIDRAINVLGAQHPLTRVCRNAVQQGHLDRTSSWSFEPYVG
ncbi:tetratricopeptide repeat protein [Streptomyces nanshensis]|uniref:tetratricopeptide repeat protein n=1 Tax=Streptomyces nanshensis TaxID=518642 RepID=UPI001495B276|nr:tetratricopeptide repeat protein [Streptomyces nanshensis]